MKFKKLIKSLLPGLTVAVACVSLAACGNAAKTAQNAAGDIEDAVTGNREITVISREDGSGTRGAFVELFGIEENGVDMTTETADITNSTSVMITGVSGNRDAIGYISMGSLSESVKAVKIDGAEASIDNVKNGEYMISRPFNIVTKDGLSDAAADFIAFILSDEGQAVVEENGYISNGSTGAYSGTKPEGKIVVSGSSSVTPVMEKLKEAYEAINPGAAIEVQQSDSTTGVNNAIDGICDIGMASRELKDSEADKGVTSTVIALDGIAVIVNNNSSIDNLTSEQVKGIYTGEITDWSEIE